eukprot:3515254-Rhodomonas_salina.1
MSCPAGCMGNRIRSFSSHCVQGQFAMSFVLDQHLTVFSCLRQTKEDLPHQRCGHVPDMPRRQDCPWGWL